MPNRRELTLRSFRSLPHFRHRLSGLRFGRPRQGRLVVALLCRGGIRNDGLPVVLEELWPLQWTRRKPGLRCQGRRDTQTVQEPDRAHCSVSFFYFLIIVFTKNSFLLILTVSEWILSLSSQITQLISASRVLRKKSFYYFGCQLLFVVREKSAISCIFTAGIYEELDHQDLKLFKTLWSKNFFKGNVLKPTGSWSENRLTRLELPWAQEGVVRQHSGFFR